MIGDPPIIPCNFRKAITEPEKVIAPMTVPRESSSKDNPEIFPVTPMPKVQLNLKEKVERQLSLVGVVFSAYTSALHSLIKDGTYAV